MVRYALIALLLTGCAAREPVVIYQSVPLPLPILSEWPTITEDDLTCPTYGEFAVVLRAHLQGAPDPVVQALYDDLSDLMCVSDEVYVRIDARDNAKSLAIKRLIAEMCSAHKDPAACMGG